MKKSDIKELERISKSIPKALIGKLEYEVDSTPETRKGFLFASKDPKLTPEQRLQAQHILDSGLLNKKHRVIDKEIEKEISEYLDAEIEKSQKLGTLTKKATLSKLKKKTWKKL